MTIHAAKYHPATLVDPPCPTATYEALLDGLDEARDALREMDEAWELWQELNKCQFPALCLALGTIRPAVEQWFKDQQAEMAEKLATLREEADLFGEPWK